MRAACRAAFTTTSTPPKGGVTVDLAACRALGATLAADAQARRAVRRAPALSRESPLSLPVRFATLEDEVNLLAVYHLLDFGSGYDAELLAHPPRRPQREALAFGVLGLHLGGRPLDAEWMAGFGLMEAQTAFGIEATVDVPLADLPGVTVSRPGPLAPLASGMRRALNETGAMLLERGKEAAASGDARGQAKSKSLGSLVLALLAEGNGLMTMMEGGDSVKGDGSGDKEAGGGQAAEEEEEAAGGGNNTTRKENKKNKGNKRLSSAAFARELVEAVPAFDDWGLLLGPEGEGKAERLCFWRRAQNLAADLARLADRLQQPPPEQPPSQQPPPPLPAELAFADGDARELSAEASPAVAAALRARALVRYAPELAMAVDAGADLSGGAGGAGAGAGGAGGAGAMQPSERALRAACVAAVDAIVEGAGGSTFAPPFTAREVSAWLSGQVTAAEEQQQAAAERQRQGQVRGGGGGGGGGGEGESADDKEGASPPNPLLLKKYVYRATTAY
jgi:hypothetical protein